MVAGSNLWQLFCHCVVFLRYRWPSKRFELCASGLLWLTVTVKGLGLKFLTPLSIWEPLAGDAVDWIGDPLHARFVLYHQATVPASLVTPHLLVNRGKAWLEKYHMHELSSPFSQVNSHLNERNGSKAKNQPDFVLVHVLYQISYKRHSLLCEGIRWHIHFVKVGAYL